MPERDRKIKKAAQKKKKYRIECFVKCAHTVHTAYYVFKHTWISY